MLNESPVRLPVRDRMNNAGSVASMRRSNHLGRPPLRRPRSSSHPLRGGCLTDCDMADMTCISLPMRAIRISKGCQ